MDKKIAFIIIFYGKKPTYLELFLKSAAYNKDIDFLFFSDWKKLPIVSDNIHYHRLKFSEFNNIAIKKGILNKEHSSPYKLCDLKPAWADILEEYIPESKYNFVGYTDIDLILGDIKKFINQEVLKEYDFFNIWNEYVSGVFSLIRNNQFNRKIYTLSKSWNLIFNDTGFFSFDENFLPKFKNKCIENIPLVSFHDIINELGAKGRLKIKKLNQNAIETRPSFLKFEKGVLKDDKNKEYLLFHYVEAKHSLFWINPFWSKVPSRFYINKHGFYKKKGFPLSYRFIILNPRASYYLLIHLYHKRIQLFRHLKYLKNKLFLKEKL